MEYGPPPSAPPERVRHRHVLGRASLAALVFPIPLVWALLRSLLPSSSSRCAECVQFLPPDLGQLQRSVRRPGHLWRLPTVWPSPLTRVLMALLSTLAGYGFARFRFPGSGPVFGLCW